MRAVNHNLLKAVHVSALGCTEHQNRTRIRNLRSSLKAADRKPFDKFSDSLHLKVTESRAEREQAFRLVHQVYLRAGLTPDNRYSMRVMRHHLANTTEVLIAKQLNRVVFTASLVRDGECGMPLESLFPAEVASMREDGVHLAEVSCLASGVNCEDKKQKFDTMVRIISLLMQTARRRGVDRLLLAVHPRHAKLYQRLFGCVLCSQVKEYAAVRGNPAVLCMHDFASLDRSGYPLYDQIYNPSYAPWQMDGTRMSDDERIYFAQAVEATGKAFVSVAA